MRELLELAARVEAASGADRELDCFAWAEQRGLILHWQEHGLFAATEGMIGWIDPGEHQRNFTCNRAASGPGSIPAYTASIDAAMTLVPADIGDEAGDGWRPTVSRTHRNTWSATLSPPWNGPDNTRKFKSGGDEATAALALCAAALRARAGWPR